MKRMILAYAIMLTSLCTSAALVQAQTPETTSGDLPYEVRTVDVRGASLRYLDFGGDGLQVWLGGVLGMRARARWAPWADTGSTAVSANAPLASDPALTRATGREQP